MIRLFSATQATRAFLIVSALGIAVPAANCQQNTAAEALGSRTGTRVRISIRDSSVERRIEGTIESVQDTIAIVFPRGGTQVTRISLASVSRIEIPWAKDENLGYKLTVEGMLLGALIANLRPPFRLPTAADAVGRLHFAEIGAPIGGTIGLLIAEKFVPDEHWVTVFDQSW